VPDAPGIRLAIKVVPGASRTEIAGWLGDTLKVRIAQPPDKGRANREVEGYLCQVFGLASGSVSIVRGRSSPRKMVEIRGISDVELRRLLHAPPGSSS